MRLSIFLLSICRIYTVFSYQELLNTEESPVAFPVDLHSNATFEEDHKGMPPILSALTSSIQPSIYIASPENTNFHSTLNTFFQSPWGHVSVCKEIHPSAKWNLIPSPQWVPNMPQMWAFHSKPNSIYYEYVRYSGTFYNKTKSLDQMVTNRTTLHDVAPDIIISDTILLITGENDMCENGSPVLVPSKNITLDEAEYVLKQFNVLISLANSDQPLNEIDKEWRSLVHQARKKVITKLIYHDKNKSTYSVEYVN